MDRVVRVLSIALALWVAVRLLPGLRFEGSALALVGTAVVIGVVNAFVRPVMTVLALPLVVVTLGLFLLVVNGIALELAIVIARLFGSGLESDGFGWTVLAAVILSIVSSIVDALARD
jgi:putative membrane protein